MDNFLLLLFALPLATIIISSVIEMSLKNPIAVGALVFAIFLIVTFAAFDASFLIYTILYAILAFISAFVTKTVTNYLSSDEDEQTSNDESTNSEAITNNYYCNSSRCNRYRNYR